MATTTSRLEDAASAATEAVSATTDAVSRATDRVREEFGTNERRIREIVDEYPISCFVGAVVVGYLLGRIATRV
jgi:hypothetical protein